MLAGHDAVIQSVVLLYFLQVSSFVELSLLATGVSAAKVVAELVVVARSAASNGCKEAFRCSGPVFGRCDRVFVGKTINGTNFKRVTFLASVVVNVLIELGLFLYLRGKLKQKLEDGIINEKMYKKELLKLICECIAGGVGSTLLGLFLQILIPIPFVGGLIGAFIGSIGGRAFGIKIGEKIGDWYSSEGDMIISRTFDSLEKIFDDFWRYA